MKKYINYAILGLMGIVLIFGIVSSVFAAKSLNTSKYTVSHSSYYFFNKDGKILVNYDVPEEEKYLYVKSDEIEIVDYSEWQKRVIKNYEIIMNKAEENAIAVKNDDTKDETEKFNAELDYQITKTNYEHEKENLKREKTTSFQSGLSNFFSIYFTAIVLLAILLLINNKIEYKVKESK